MYCPKCGALLEKIGQQFCGSCGSPTNQMTVQMGNPIPNNINQLGSPPLYPSNNALAVIGFVMALFCCSPVGLILSVIGLNQINQRPQQYKGKGFAISGIILGVIGIFLGIIYYSVLFNEFSSEF